MVGNYGYVKHEIKTCLKKKYKNANSYWKVVIIGDILLRTFPNFLKCYIVLFKKKKKALSQVKAR